MSIQSFDYQWKWELMLHYPLYTLLCLGAFYAFRHWLSRQQGDSRPSMDWRFNVPLALMMGLALGALANSTHEFDEAQAHRQGNWEVLTGNGYVYKETLERLSMNEMVTTECSDIQVVDWDFGPVNGHKAVNYHVFCREGEVVMEVANIRHQ